MLWTRFFPRLPRIVRVLSTIALAILTIILGILLFRHVPIQRSKTTRQLITTASTTLHDAVRIGSLSDVITLLDSGSNINALDERNRTALTLALQLERFEIAVILLRRGAEFTLVPRDPAQRADTDYVTVELLAVPFQLRLLSQQLLRLDANDARHQPEVSLDLFSRNLNFQLPNIDWTIQCTPCYPTSRCPGCQHLLTLSGTQSLPLWARGARSAMRAERIHLANKTLFELSLTDPNIPCPVPSPQLEGTFIMAPALFSSTGLLTIPSCEFDFARNPTCYPGVRIENETDRAAREVQGSFGTVSFATPPLQIEQLGEERLLQPGESLIADRSTSPIHLRIHASDAKVFDFKLSISPVPGPSTEVGRELDLSSRLKTYSRIAALSDEIQQLGNATGPDLVVRAKTLATAIHLLSASAVNRQYLEHLKVELKNRAAEIIALDDQVLQLRDVILANSQMTPDEIDRLIARVESLVETVPPSEREALLQIRTELQVARDAVGSTTSQIAIFRERFYTWIDKIITRYQGTVLEYAQYVSVDEIERGGPISSGDLNTILRKVRAADVFITDSVFGGRGAQLRSRFGLPDPVR